MIVNPGTEINFEGKTFRHCADEIDIIFDTYVLKSKGNNIKFSTEGFEAYVETSKFPNGFFGFGFFGSALRDCQPCYCHGALDRITFETEFEAQVAAIKLILKIYLGYDYNRNIIRMQLESFINPKSLF